MSGYTIKLCDDAGLVCAADRSSAFPKLLFGSLNKISTLVVR